MKVSNYSTRDEMRADQLVRLRRLLDVVAADNPFYRSKLREAGLDGGLSSLAEFFEKMPFTEKQELVDDQAAHPPFGTNLTYPLEDYSRFNQTSATSSRPMRWIDTPDGWQGLVENWKQVLHAAGVERADVLYFAFSFGPFLGFWTGWDAATQLGCLSIPGGGLSSVARLAAIRDNQATVLMCTPTYALRLAEIAAENQIGLGEMRIRKIIVAGEPGGSVPAVRKRIEDCWPGAAVFDHHGMTEVGPVSHECPQQPGTLLIIESAYLPEIVEPGGTRPVAPGELGELILTTLNRVGSPLIRYRTGDLVREDPDVAGRHGYPQMALAGGILDRADDMVMVRGVNVFPSAVDDVIRSFADVAEYRVEVSDAGSMAELNVRVEPVPECADAGQLAARIELRLRLTFSLRMPVAVCDHNELPRFKAKARRWVRI